MIERLPQGTAGFLVAELGPEEGEQAVAPVKPPGSVGGEIGQDRQPLRLAQHRLGLPTVRG